MAMKWKNTNSCKLIELQSISIDHELERQDPKKAKQKAYVSNNLHRRQKRVKIEYNPNDATYYFYLPSLLG